MSRIRTVKPEFYQHEFLSELSAEAHLLAGGLLNYADDDGYFNANPELIKAAVFPTRELSGSIPVMLQELSRRPDFIQLGNTEDGRQWGRIKNFRDHQVISHAKPSKIKTLKITWHDSSNFPVTVHPEWKGMEGNGKGKELKPSARKPRGPVSKASQVSTANGESRHKRIEGMVKAAWEQHNPGAGACPFGAADGKQLQLMLDTTQSWPDSNYAQCLMHMYASEGFPRSQLPMQFLPRLPSYFTKPKDRFDRELGSNGSGKASSLEVEMSIGRNSCELTPEEFAEQVAWMNFWTKNKLKPNDPETRLKWEEHKKAKAGNGHAG